MRFESVSVEQATGKTQQLYQGVKAKLGGVPNLFQGVGKSPAALEALVGILGALDQAELDFKQREAVALAVSQVNECGYCISAHTALGKLAGFEESETLDIRRGKPSDSKLKALVEFAKTVLKNRGNVSSHDLEKVKNSGYSQAQIIETIMVIALTVFTNFFNEVNQTVVDFPETEKI